MGMLEDFADTAGNIATGVGHALIDNTKVGRILIDPFMDNTPKQQFREDSMAFTRESQARQKSLWGQQDKARSMKFESDMIKSHSESSKKNFMSMAEGLPEYKNLTDVDKNKYLDSLPAKNLVKFQALGRMGMNAFKDKSIMPAFNRMVQENGMSFSEKDGKRYISSPDGKEQIELTDDNFSNMMNGLQQQASQELQTHAAMSQWSNNIKGQSQNDMIKAIAPAFGGSYSTAYSNVEKFYEANNFTPQEKRIHYLKKGLEKYFDDGVITNEEKEGVMEELQFLAKGMGVKSSIDQGGNIYVHGEGGVQLPLKTYYDQLGDLDKVGLRFDDYMKQFNYAGEKAEGVLEQQSAIQNTLLDGVDPETNEQLQSLGFVKGDNPDEMKAVSDDLQIINSNNSMNDKQRSNATTAYKMLLDYAVNNAKNVKDIEDVHKKLLSEFDLNKNQLPVPAQAQAFYDARQVEQEATIKKNKERALKEWDGFMKTGKLHDPLAGTGLTRRPPKKEEKAFNRKTF